MSQEVHQNYIDAFLRKFYLGSSCYTGSGYLQLDNKSVSKYILLPINIRVAEISIEREICYCIVPCVIILLWIRCVRSWCIEYTEHLMKNNVKIFCLNSGQSSYQMRIFCVL